MLKDTRRLCRCQHKPVSLNLGGRTHLVHDAVASLLAGPAIHHFLKIPVPVGGGRGAAKWMMIAIWLSVNRGNIISPFPMVSGLLCVTPHAPAAGRVAKPT